MPEVLRAGEVCSDWVVRQASWQEWRFKLDGLVIGQRERRKLSGWGRSEGKCRGKKMKELLKKRATSPEWLEQIDHVGEKALLLGTKL